MYMYKIERVPPSNVGPGGYWLLCKSKDVWWPLFYNNRSGMAVFPNLDAVLVKLKEMEGT
jgi:hypothetical protein